MHTKARQAGGRSLLRPSCRTAEGRVAGCPGLDVAGAEARGVPGVRPELRGACMLLPWGAQPRWPRDCSERSSGLWLVSS